MKKTSGIGWLTLSVGLLAYWNLNVHATFAVFPETDKIAKKVKELQTQITVVRQELLVHRDKRDRAKDQLRRYNHHLQKIVGEKKQLQVRLKHMAVAKQEAFEQGQHALFKQKQAGDLLRGIYESTLLAEPRFARDDNHLFKDYLFYLNQSQVKQLLSITQQLRALVKLNQTLQKEERQLISQSSVKASLKSDYQQKLSKITKSLAKVKLQEQQQLLRLTHLGEKKSKLSKLIEELTVKRQSGFLFTKQKGFLAWPIALRDAGNRQVIPAFLGNGIKLAAKQGTKVQAVFGGWVVYSNWLKGYGLLMILDHGDGFMTLYAHNQKLYKDVGQTVTTGELIGEVGTTGGIKEAGLYFEIRKDGRVINPDAWLINLSALRKNNKSS